MKITEKFLKEKDACSEGIEYVIANKYIGLERKAFLEKLIAEDKLDWANWLIVRTMKYKQYVSYAVFAAEQVIDIYEKKYSNKNAPRKAIEAAKLCIQAPTKQNKAAAAAYAAAAYAAAAYAAAYAAYAAAAYNNAVRKEIKIKILNYGLSLL